MSSSSVRRMTIIKAVVGVTLLILVIRQVDPAELAETIAAASYSSLLLAFVLFGLSRAFEAARLFVLVARSGAGVRDVVEIVFVSTFFNNFAAAVVGDGYRVLAMSKCGPGWERSLFLIVVERMLGLLTVVVLAAILIGRNPIDLTGVFVPVEPGASTGGLLVAAIVLVMVAAGYLLARKRDWPGEVLRTVLRLSRDVRFDELAGAFLLTVAAQVSLAAMVYVLVSAFGESISFEHNLMAMLLAYVAAYIPISVGALGVREGAIVAGLVFFSVTEPIAIAAAITSRVLIYVYAASAGVWWTSRKP